MYILIDWLIDMYMYAYYKCHNYEMLEDLLNVKFMNINEDGDTTKEF